MPKDIPGIKDSGRRRGDRAHRHGGRTPTQVNEAAEVNEVVLDVNGVGATHGDAVALRELQFQLNELGLATRPGRPSGTLGSTASSLAASAEIV